MLQRFAHCEHDLVAHEVDPGHFFRDGMFHLDSLVDLEEIVIAAVIDDELHRAGVGIMGGFSDAHGRLADFIAQFAELVVQQRRGGFFDQFLVAPLHRAVALAQMDDATLIVAQDLNLDMVRILDVFFDIDAGIAERLFGLRRAV